MTSYQRSGVVGYELGLRVCEDGGGCLHGCREGDQFVFAGQDFGKHVKNGFHLPRLSPMFPEVNVKEGGLLSVYVVYGQGFTLQS